MENESQFSRNIKNYFLSLVKGTGQVMFQENTKAGILMLLAILFAPVWSDTRLVLIPAAVIALIVVSTAAWLLRLNGKEKGVWGFNGILTGCAIATFFNLGVYTWILLLVGVLITIPIKSLLDRLLSGSSYTLPFVIATWLIIIMGIKTGLCSQFDTDTLPVEINPTPIDYAKGLLKGISQVFLIDSYDTGLLLLAALYCSCRSTALLALAGSATGMVLAWLAGCPEAEILSGIWGFSPVLTAIAIGTAQTITQKRALLTIAALSLTFAIQYITTPLLSKVGLPVLTMPFCIATILVIKLTRRHSQPQQ
ncbi:MAG: urea transporter [Clostridiales bacterium]|nr:urea transporter [Clostridiales bacterium]